MSRTTSELRELWKAYECAAKKMIRIPFGSDEIRVAPPTADAWKALAMVLKVHGYLIRTEDTDSYNCREITGGVGKSLHSYGIALDVNWKTNPYTDHAGTRNVVFSGKATQDARALDVKQKLADTDMPSRMIEAVRAIATVDGKRVFEWGGDWQSVKDCMHFEIDLGPDELAVGIDWNTVPVQAAASAGSHAGNAALPAPTAFTHRVIARLGLRLRSGPGVEFQSIVTLPFETRLVVIDRSGNWAQVDLQGDGAADGFMHEDFLRAL
ncbi:M15 family metallopeptidase [Nevskia sp.]|uniref:M15 family metallopeptidase n=1 Tax=Nevskia sp. TaxID=1929292 RepID=UPI0025E85EAF|nr:M15 family metallopeptidase [Nevskia sp.]